MCDPVPTHSDRCVKCGNFDKIRGYVLCEACAEAWSNRKVSEDGLSPALPPTGAKQPDPGLQTDRWELDRMSPGRRVAAKARFDLDPKDVVIEVTYMNHSHSVRVYLRHKPTDCICQEEGPDVQKEAIHSRLWGKLKGMVEGQAGEKTAPVFGLNTETAAMIKDCFGPGLAYERFKSLCRELKTPGFCNGPKYSEREAFEMAVEGLARTVPEPQPKDQPVKILLRELLGISTSNRRGVGERVDAMRNLILAFQEKHIFLPLVPRAEQPSSQVHPDSSLPSRRPG